MTTKRLKITVGTPSATEYLHRRYVQSLIDLKYPKNTDIYFSQIFGVQLPFARNEIVEIALKNESEYLFFIDADMVFPADTLVRLLKHNKDIVNALAFRRIKPHYPCVFKWNKNCYETVDYSVANNGLLEVEATGMSCILIKTDVFKKLQRPWYYYRDHLFSSDITFCENARKAGYSIWIDTGLKIGHLGAEKVIDEEYYLKHFSPEAKQKWNRGMKDFMSERAVRKELYNKQL